VHGPKGVGALYINRRAGFRPTLIGGGQENDRRAGTENVASIVGFGKAAELAIAAVADESPRIRALRDRFEQGVIATIAGTTVNGASAPRLPNTSSLSFADVAAEAALILLDKHRICCSAGSACHAGSIEPSHVLRAMKLSDERARSSLRFSFGRFNSDADVDRALEIVPTAIARVQAATAGAAQLIAKN
jgi:cysteine desulfurase